jgi:hypothetical protein
MLVPMRVLAAAVVLLAAPLALARVCSDPCREAARGDWVTCRRAATAAFALDRQLCLDRDPACVQACSERENDCGEATGLDPALEACLAQEGAAVSQCRDRFPAGSMKREHCVDNARIAGFQCRNRARTAAAPALRRCRVDFHRCAARCGPASRPRNARSCKRGGRGTRTAALAACNQTANADKSGCANKDAACVTACRDSRVSCDAPARNALASAIAACQAERRSAAATCEATNPAGSSALDQCLEAADTNAFLCRQAASKAQAPAFATCVQQYIGCVRLCPAA